MAIPRTKPLEGVCSHCGRGITFPAELIGTSTACPHCGQTTELLLPQPEIAPTLPRRVIVWTLVAVLVLVSGLVASLVALNRAQRLATRQKLAEVAPAQSPLPAEGAQATVARGTEVDGFEVSTVQVEKPSTGGRAYAVGTVANRLDRPRKAVRIELDLFNATGQKVGVAMDSTPLIEPAGRWQFRAPVIVPQAIAAKLASVREQSPPPGP